MLFCEERRFVFIAVPKTGTTSLEMALERQDPAVLRNRLRTPEGELVKVPKHLTVARARELLGARADAYRFVGFMREPLDRTISAYFYLSAGRAWQRFREGRRGDRLLGLRSIVSRLLPPPLWFALYPFRAQHHYVRRRDGSFGLDFCGRTEHLADDAQAMLRFLGYGDSLTLTLDRLNAAPREPFPPWQARLIERILRLRLARDLRLYRGFACGERP